MYEFEPNTFLLCGGLLVGLAFGAMAQRSAFCFRSVITDANSGKFSNAAILYLTALSIAIFGTQYLLFSVDINMDGIIQLTPGHSIGGMIIGGVIFGIGMIITKGCPLRHIILAGEGSARSWLVLLLVAISGYATIRGILALVRLPIENIGRFYTLNEINPVITFPQLISSNVESHMTIGLLIGGLLGMAVFIKAMQKGMVRKLLYGAAIGLMIPASWYVTGVLGYDEFNPVAAEGLSFIAPLANSLQFLMTYTGATASFGITLFAGCLLGAIAASIFGKEFSFRSFESQKDILRYALGAMMLGFGSVLALGCSIGQGLSGLSLLSISSFIAVLAISFGGYLGLRFFKPS